MEDGDAATLDEFLVHGFMEDEMPYPLIVVPFDVSSEYKRSGKYSLFTFGNSVVIAVLSGSE